MAADSAVEGAPALVLRMVSPPRAQRIAPGSWDWGPEMIAVPGPVRWRRAALMVVRLPLRERVFEAGTSMVPPVLWTGGLRSPQAEKMPPWRCKVCAEMEAG